MNNKIITTILLFIFSLVVFADSQLVIDYEYDDAGNVIGINAGQNLGPPDVTDLSPPFINKESFAFVTATGVNLNKATVSLNTTDISLIDVTSVSNTEIKFTLFADETAAIGNVPITFLTRLGTDIENIAVAERTPIVSTDPNPIILSPDSQSADVLLTFDQPFTTEQVFDVAITDDSVASISAQSITLLAGETEVNITVTGLVSGSTTLEINQLSNFLALAIPVVVNSAQLPTGQTLTYSQPLGISIYTGPVPFSGTGIFTAETPLGVSIYTGPVPISVSGIFSTGNTLGVALGTTVNQTTPATVRRNASAILTLTGFNLDAVTATSFNSADGITQTGAFTVTPDGTQMTIPISVSSIAQVGTRFIVLATPSGNVMVQESAFQITN